MATLLHLDSSGQNEASVSRKLSAHYAKTWQEANPSGRIIYRDLTASNLPFLDNERIVALNTPAEHLTAEQKKLNSLPDELMAELQSADVLAIGLPMYNFSAPAVFKAWIDLIVRAGMTYSFAGGRPEGLLKNKKVVILSASGSDFSQGPYKQYDFLEPWVRTIFGFIGLTDVTVIKSYGTNPDVIGVQSKIALEAIDGQFAAV